MLWMIRNTKTGKFATDTRGAELFIVVSWGKRGDAEMLTQREHDIINAANFPKHWVWVRQGEDL